MKIFLEYIGFRTMTTVQYLLPSSIIENVLSCTLKTLRYRKDVIDTNLKSAFPSKSRAELSVIKTKFYNHLAHVLTLQSKGSKNLHIVYNDTEQLKELAKKWKTVLLVGSHYGCWETTGKLLTPLLQPLAQYVAYKKIKNPMVDGYVYKKRSDTAAEPIEMKQLYRSVLDNKLKSNPSIYYMIADQFPSALQDIRQAKFLGLETWFINGPEKLSKKLAIPVVFMDITIAPDDTYNVNFVPLYIPDVACQDKIVTAYAKALEAQIKRAPQYWLWSHKRWKNLKLYK